MIALLLKVAIRREHDILLVRQRGRQISRFLGFSDGDATRITTALSEVARNAFEYAGGGYVAFTIESQALDREDLVIRVTDQGSGIRDIAAVLASDFKSRTGMGIGLKGSRALMDRFELTSVPNAGTTVMMAKHLPWAARKFGASEAARLAEVLAKAGEATPLAELQTQNQALIGALQELNDRQAEIQRLSEVAEHARERAEAAQHVAERSRMVRERFMALTTHELRTPLNAILGYLDLLDIELASSINEVQRGYFARVQRACKHLLGLTNDFLDMAQDDAGHLIVSRALGPVRQVMSEACALVAPQSAVRNIALHCTEVHDALLYLADVNRVRQILVNLLGNAVSFSPPGGSVKVIAERMSAAPPGNGLAEGPWCTIRVEDSGPGIPDDKIGHVFEAFVQLSSDGQSTRKGSGLGLTVSRQLALLMGGDLTASSSGTGAVFTLWLCEGAAPPTQEAMEPVSADVVPMPITA